MKALLVERSLPRFAAARLAGAFASSKGAGLGPLRLADVDPPELPDGDDWFRLRPILSGICGSDLSTLGGRSSRYFDELVSFPFVPGHELVATLEGPGYSADGRRLEDGSRVVVEPVLGCVARRFVPQCKACAAGDTGDCENVSVGHLRPGVQTGFCADTGGGWSTGGLVAHSSQIHPVPEELSDRDAVMIEPLACGIHAAMTAEVREGDTVAVVGAGTLGLVVTAALTHLAATGRVRRPSGLLLGARYAHQRRLGEELGATRALATEQLSRALRRRTASLALGAPQSSTLRLSGGADVVFDCVGTAESIEQCLSMTRPRGKVVLVGMPGKVRVDLAALWHREIELVGAYTYGTERLLISEETAKLSAVRTFELAIELSKSARAGRLVSATYPIERFEEAITHAGSAGRRGAVKIAFDPTERPTPTTSKKGMKR